MPLRNIQAHPVRALVLLLLAAAQAACVFAGVTLAENSRGDLSLAEGRLGADVLVYPAEASSRIDTDSVVMQGTPVAVYGARTDLANMADCDGISAVSYRIYLPGPEGGPTWVVGFDPETDFTLAPWLEEGSGFEPPAGYAIAGCNVAAENGTVDLYGKPWPVSAHVAQTDSELDDAVFVRFDDLKAVIDDASASGIGEVAGVDPLRDYSVALVRVADKGDVERVSNWLKVYVRKTETVRSDEALTETAAGISWQSVMIGVASAAVWLVLLAALAVAQSMSMRERKGELFVWRASGASRKTIARVLRRESLFLNVAGAVIGVGVAVLIVVLFWPDAALAPAGSIILAVASVGLSALAGLVSSLIAVRKTMGELDGQMLVAA